MNKAELLAKATTDAATFEILGLELVTAELNELASKHQQKSQPMGKGQQFSRFIEFDCGKLGTLEELQARIKLELTELANFGSVSEPIFRCYDMFAASRAIEGWAIILWVDEPKATT